MVIIAFSKWCKEMMDIQNPHPTGSKHQPFQTFVNNFTSTICPKKNPSTPPFNHAKPSASNLHLRIGIVGHVIFISLSLLMFALLVVWVIQQAMPRPGKKKDGLQQAWIFFRCDDSGWIKNATGDIFWVGIN